MPKTNKQGKKPVMNWEVQRIDGLVKDIQAFAVNERDMKLVKHQMGELKRQMVETFNMTVTPIDYVHRRHSALEELQRDDDIQSQLVEIQRQIVDFQKVALLIPPIMDQVQTMWRQAGILAKRKREFLNRHNYNRTLMFLHIARSAGASFDDLAHRVANKIHYNYIGTRRFFDWNQINATGIVGDNVDVITVLRDPIARAVSHFHYYKRQEFSAGMRIQRQNLTNYLMRIDPQNLLNTRDVWQDGQAGVSWLTGTHISDWVGCPEWLMDIRETLALDGTAMCLLAAERLRQVRWFGILEEWDRSIELLKHEFNLSSVPKMRHHNKGQEKQYAELTDPEQEALASLMPRDLWLYDYAKRLFEARWQAYQTGVYDEPEYPPLPDPFSCVSTRFELNCTLGPYSGNFQGVFGV